jgi:2-polyprenyl-6-methoxyphenol hydroxylase-like FAD-dependent oxidoreductase
MKGDYAAASPCTPVDLPQTLLEPMLVRYATSHGFKLRFDTVLQSFNSDSTTGLTYATVHDKISKREYQIRTKYLFGADGGRSKTVEQLGLPLIAKPSQGVAINVLVKADLSHLAEYRRGGIHWILQPDRENPEFGSIGVVRMVKPWYEWMFTFITSKEYDGQTQPSKDEYLTRVQEVIGDNTPAEVLHVSRWIVNETVAERFSEGNT